MSSSSYKLPTPHYSSSSPSSHHPSSVTNKRMKVNETSEKVVRKYVRKEVINAVENKGGQVREDREERRMQYYIDLVSKRQLSNTTNNSEDNNKGEKKTGKKPGRKAGKKTEKGKGKTGAKENKKKKQQETEQEIKIELEEEERDTEMRFEFEQKNYNFEVGQKSNEREEAEKYLGVDINMEETRSLSERE